LRRLVAATEHRAVIWDASALDRLAKAAMNAVVESGSAQKAEAFATFRLAVPLAVTTFTSGAGTGVGDGVGLGVGAGVGDGVGLGVGEGVGDGVGLGVGAGVACGGEGVGLGVGAGVGEGVGLGVGAGVACGGEGVGLGVGAGVGDGVGLGVGAGVCAGDGAGAKESCSAEMGHAPLESLLPWTQAPVQSKTVGPVQALQAASQGRQRPMETWRNWPALQLVSAAVAVASVQILVVSASTVPS